MHMQPSVPFRLANNYNNQSLSSGKFWNLKNVTGAQSATSL